MSDFIIDASVAAKWFFPEKHTDAALRFLDNSFALAAPDLLLAEIGNLLWKRSCLGHLKHADAQLVLKALRAAPLEIEPTEKYLALALDIAVSLDCSVYDSLYLSVATTRQSRMVTADRGFYEAIGRSSLADHAVWIEDEL